MYKRQIQDCVLDADRTGTFIDKVRNPQDGHRLEDGPDKDFDMHMHAAEPHLLSHVLQRVGFGKDSSHNSDTSEKHSDVDVEHTIEDRVS